MVTARDMRGEHPRSRRILTGDRSSACIASCICRWHAPASGWRYRGGTLFAGRWLVKLRYVSHPNERRSRARTDGSAQVADQVRERCVLRERRMTLEQRRETSARIGSDRGYRSFELRAKGSERPVEPGLGVRVFRMQRIGLAILRHGVV